MKLTDRLKALWRLLGTADAVEQLNDKSATALRQIGEMSARIDSLAKRQQELETTAEDLLRKVQAEIDDIRKDVIGLKGDFAAVDEMAQKKVQEISDKANALLADVGNQVKSCREGASQLEPEIKRLAEAVLELNG